MLYRFDLAQPSASPRAPTRTPAALEVLEKHIEEFLTTHLYELISEDKLMLIGQERSHQEEADLFALDNKGVLYIFEIKRWSGDQENVLQVLRYGQKFGRYTYGQLEKLAHSHQKLEGSLRDSHQKYFQLDSPLAESSFNVDQRFVVVTNGTDKDTLGAVEYWTKKGVKIHCALYKFYEVEGHPYIQFDTYDPEFGSQSEFTPGIYIVNTNQSYMENAWLDMIGKGKASAYYGRKTAVQRIEPGSIIYLYHTGHGVIAKGRATSSVQAADYDGDPQEEYYIPIRFDWVITDKLTLKKAVKAAEVNARMGSGHRFRQTVIGITKEMSDVIDQIWKEHSTGGEQTV